MEQSTKYAVIFDMDGVLVDSEPYHMEAERKVFKYLGIEVSEKLHHSFVGILSRNMWRQIIEKFNLDHAPSELVKLQRRYYEDTLNSIENIEPIEGILELLKILVQHNFKLAVASSSPYSQIKYYLDRFGFRQYFTVITSGQDVERGKPDPEIFVITAEKLGVPKDKCVVIEDSKNGIESAVKAGMKCIGFRNPSSGNQNLSRANFIIEKFENDTFRLIQELF